MPIEHIVVLMLENRSFDNVLGGLYGPGNAPPYQQAPTGQAGLVDIPPGAANPGGPTGPVFAHNQTAPAFVAPTGATYSPTTIPLIDPGEAFDEMAQQLMGLPTVPSSLPWGSYSPSGPSAGQGYVLNYAQIGGVPAENLRDVMNYFTPAQLPVSAFLANRYGLSDEWFASVPSQTYVNRAFALSAAPSVAGGLFGGFSLIDDLQYGTDPLKELPTILQQLDDALPATGATGPFWKVYFHDYSITLETVPYVSTRLATGQNVGTFDGSDWGSQTPTQLGSNPVASSFVDDLKNGWLPKFSWIEPRYFDNYARNRLPPNSNHPGSAWTPLGILLDTPHWQIDAAAGEVLLMELYNRLRASPLWDTTLLIVTYDEHGGVWDRVPPPFATPPGHGIPTASNHLDPAADGFNFNVFGGRVPAIVVSPLVPPGSLFRAPAGGPPFDHTSIIKTVRDVFLAPLGVTTPLTDRDAAAPSLLPGLTAAAVNDTGFCEGMIVAGPSSLYFPASDLSPQTVFASAGPNFPLGASAVPAGGWLQIQPGGATAMTITVNVDPRGLTAGAYFGHVAIFSTGATAAANSPLRVPVQFDAG